MRFSGRESWTGLLFPTPGNLLPTLGLNPRLLHLLPWQVGSLPLAPPGKTSQSIRALYFKWQKIMADLEWQLNLGWLIRIKRKWIKWHLLICAVLAQNCPHRLLEPHLQGRFLSVFSTYWKTLRICVFKDIKWSPIYVIKWKQAR